jgi:hypothetical protein
MAAPGTITHVLEVAAAVAAAATAHAATITETATAAAPVEHDGTVAPPPA